MYVCPFMIKEKGAATKIYQIKEKGKMPLTSEATLNLIKVFYLAHFVYCKNAKFQIYYHVKGACLCDILTDWKN